MAFRFVIAVGLLFLISACSSKKSTTSNSVNEANSDVLSNELKSEASDTLKGYINNEPWQLASACAYNIGEFDGQTTYLVYLSCLPGFECFDERVLEISDKPPLPTIQFSTAAGQASRFISISNFNIEGRGKLTENFEDELITARIDEVTETHVHGYLSYPRDGSLRITGRFSAKLCEKK